MVSAVDQNPVDAGFPHFAEGDFLLAGELGHAGIEALDMAQGKPARPRGAMVWRGRQLGLRRGPRQRGA
jgi:hypothetical protein